jgi:hypothetical protein
MTTLVTPPSTAPNSEAAGQLLGELQRYAGWLGRDVRPTSLRSSIEELATAMGSNEGVSGALQGVQTDMDRLGSGGVTGLLRRTLRKLAAELA